jgi:predicted nucleic acid-binding protein
VHFLDTNIVLRLLNTAAPEHEVVRRSVEKLEAGGEQLAIGLQVLVESWVVLTRPAENNGFGWSATQAHAALSATRTRFTLLVDDENTAAHWLDVVSAQSVMGKRAHDARIAALMASHGVSSILTLNGQDFAGMPGIVTVRPGE